MIPFEVSVIPGPFPLPTGKFVICPPGFELVPGSLFRLRGPNGCGKSTLLHAIVDTIVGPKKRADRRISHVGVGDVSFLPQFLEKGQDLRVSEVLGLRQHPAVSRALFREHYPHEEIPDSRRLLQLSGGQQQFLRVAVAAGSTSGVHLYDEPFRSLDPERRNSVAECIRQLVRDGRGVVLVDHEPEGIIQIDPLEQILTLERE